MAKGMTLAEVLADNFAVAADDETTAMITVNGSYMQLWTQFDDGSWDCRDARCSGGKRYCDMTFTEIDRAAAEYLDEVLHADYPECGSE